MNIIARRITYLTAFVVFGLTAPLLIARTAGYVWTGWRGGFVHASTLVVHSTPRATVWLNGQRVGPTPRRLANVAPGTYHLELRAEGRQPWSQYLRLEAGTARVVGPVVLFPLRFTRRPIAAPAEALFVASRPDGHVAAVTPSPGGWSVRTTWPSLSPTAWIIPEKPRSMIEQPSGRLTLLVGETAAYIVAADRPELMWTVPAMADPAWDESTPNLLYGRRAGFVYRYDALTKTDERLFAAESFALINGELWSTETAAGATRLFRRPPFGQNTPRLVVEDSGLWALQPGPRNAVVLQADDGRTSLGRVDRITGLVSWSDLGRTDRLFWSQTKEPPLWQDGAQIRTERPVGTLRLIDRGPQEYSHLAWIVAGHIMLTVDDAAVNIRSVSPRQGRQVLMSWTLGPSSRVVAIDPAHRRFVVAIDNSNGSLEEFSW